MEHEASPGINRSLKDYKDFIFENSIKIQTRKKEWRRFAALGIMLYLVGFAALRLKLDNTTSNTVIIQILLTPLIIPIALKMKIKNHRRIVDSILAAHFNKISSYFPEMYEMLISIKMEGVEKLARKFRKLSLFSVICALYVISAIITIFINFIITR